MRRLIPLVLLIASGCDFLKDYTECPVVPADRLSRLPAKLSETGLYSDAGTKTLADGVRPYHPQFELWSDGAEKARFVRLPDGVNIDTSDMDDWQFPAGTRLWKEFRFGGRLVETRILEKFGPAA